VILGNAPVNTLDAGHQPEVEGLLTGGKYGGAAPDDDSGILKYVRVEYSGTKIGPNNELNGITFGGVGSKTVVDFVQVRQSADDCFEFFGGTVNAKHLVCQYNEDDGIDWDNGWTGKLQFVVVQQKPGFDDETNGFEADNNAGGTEALPLSEPTIYNVTLCGKGQDNPKEEYAMLLRRATKGHIFNVLAIGFEAGLDIRNGLTAAYALDGGLELKNSIFAAMVNREIAYPEDGGAQAAPPHRDDDNGLDEQAWFLGNGNVVIADGGVPSGVTCSSATTLSLGPTPSLAANARTPPADGFFDTAASYVGAFKDRDDGWARCAPGARACWIVWSPS
jgi:hypothetical protein